MYETQDRPREWFPPSVGALLQFALAAALLFLGHTLPGVLLLCAGVALLASALSSRARSSRMSAGGGLRG